MLGRRRNAGPPVQDWPAGHSSCDPAAPHKELHASRACTACARPSLAHGGPGSSRQSADKMRGNSE
eukprot:9149337-Lingulodinium_polyedra.AAC.1